MRIDPNQGAQPLPESDRTSSQSSASQNHVSGGSALGEDQAQLSGAHVQVQALAAQVAQFPDTRLEKVSALRQLVLGDGYQRSSKQLAGALFDHMVGRPAA